jgi:hypothetical protein
MYICIKNSIEGDISYTINKLIRAPHEVEFILYQYRY